MVIMRWWIQYNYERKPSQKYTNELITSVTYKCKVKSRCTYTQTSYMTLCLLREIATMINKEDNTY